MRHVQNPGGDRPQHQAGKRRPAARAHVDQVVPDRSACSTMLSAIGPMTV